MVPDLDAQIDRLLQAEAAEGAFSGVVALAQAGEIAYRAAYGYANRPFEVLNRFETRFRLASVSKLFTSVAVMQLVAAGKMRLDDPIHAHLDLQASRIPAGVTLEHLLTMSAGIADWFEESGDWDAAWEAVRRIAPPYRLRRNEDFLPLFLNKSPLAAPGERVAYSNAAYILLALAVQAASGMDFYTYVRRRIFAAAGMASSDFIALDQVRPGVAEGYVPIEDDGGVTVAWERNIYRVPAGAAGDGSATGCASDLLALLNALRDGALLPEDAAGELFAPRRQEYDEHIRGYRWMRAYAGTCLLDPQDGQVVRWGITGEEDGVSCRLYAYPDHQIDLVILGNQSWCAGSLGWALHSLIIESTA